MRKLHIFFLAAALAVGICSCESSKQEASKNTTFVVTKADSKGGIYSVLVFEELTQVSATYMKTNDKYDFPVSNCSYTRGTSQVSIKGIEKLPLKISNYVFTIMGVPAFPAEFILHDGIYKRVQPGVFINGKKAVPGTDYTFDQKTNHLTFITPVDSDKDSYDIIWLTSNGTSAMSNNIEKYQSQYKKLESAWYKSIR